MKKLVREIFKRDKSGVLDFSKVTLESDPLTGELEFYCTEKGCTRRTFFGELGYNLKIDLVARFPKEADQIIFQHQLEIVVAHFKEYHIILAVNNRE